jgi:ABC-2 type transport system ATP-binding protein
VSDVEGALEVTGAPIEQIGDLAGQANITLHELATQSGSLEEAFIQLTGDSVEYGQSRAHDGQPPGPPMPGAGPIVPAPMQAPMQQTPMQPGPLQQGGEQR